MKRLSIFFAILIMTSYISAMNRAIELASSAQQVAQIINALEQQLITILRGNYTTHEVNTVIGRYLNWADKDTLQRKVPGTTYTFADLINKIKTKYNLP